MPKRKSTKFKKPLIILPLIILAAVFIFFFLRNKTYFFNLFKDTPKSQTISDASLAQMARDVVAKCAGQSYKPACYDEEVPKLMNQSSMRQAFDVTRMVQEEDPSFTYCHV